MSQIDFNPAADRAVEIVQGQPNGIIARDALVTQLRTEGKIPQDYVLQSNDLGRIVFRLQRVDAQGNPAKNVGGFYKVHHKVKNTKTKRPYNRKPAVESEKTPDPTSQTIPFTVTSLTATGKNKERFNVNVPKGLKVVITYLPVILIIAAVVAVIAIVGPSNIAQALGN